MERSHGTVRALDLVGGGEILPRQECLDLLEATQIGRLGVVVNGRVEIFPVNYVFDDGCVVFGSNLGRKMASDGDGHATFEIDAIDLQLQSGWSVVVHGVLEDVSDEADEYKSARSWVGHKDRLLKLTPHQITGRQVRAHQLD